MLVNDGERWQGTYIELVLLSHQCVVQQMPIDLQMVSNSHGADVQTYLRLDQHQVNK